MSVGRSGEKMWCSGVVGAEVPDHLDKKEDTDSVLRYHVILECSSSMKIGIAGKG